MCKTQCILALLALCTGLAHSFSWDIAVRQTHQLEFYSKGNLTHSEDLPSFYICGIIYDPVRNRVLICDDPNNKVHISSFDIATKKKVRLITTLPGDIKFGRNPAYDPVTDLLFWAQNDSIFSLSLNQPDSYKVVTVDEEPQFIAVDSCGGFIYWVSGYQSIKKARFDGSDTQVIIYQSYSVFLFGLTIDPQTQKMCWTANDYTIDREFSVKCADLNGKNERKLFKTGTYDLLAALALTVSNDSIYWINSFSYTLWQLPKNPDDEDLEATKFSKTSYEAIATNYKIEDQIQGIENCEALKNLLPINIDHDSVNNSAAASLLCVHGTEVSGESQCECTQGYTGDRCEVSVCHNYCVQGDCSVNAEGQPKCRCNIGYYGERCEVNVCEGFCLNNGDCSLNENNMPVCRCTAGYGGDRCNVSVCHNYCFRGDCSVSAEGLPKCRCNAGYSGDRCEVNVCEGYCGNNGDCSLNETNMPVCRCTRGYGGNNVVNKWNDIINWYTYYAKGFQDENKSVARTRSKQLLIVNNINQNGTEKNIIIGDENNQDNPEIKSSQPPQKNEIVNAFIENTFSKWPEHGHSSFIKAIFPSLRVVIKN